MHSWDERKKKGIGATARVAKKEKKTQSIIKKDQSKTNEFKVIGLGSELKGFICVGVMVMKPSMTRGLCFRVRRERGGFICRF